MMTMMMTTMTQRREFRSACAHIDIARFGGRDAQHHGTDGVKRITSQELVSRAFPSTDYVVHTLQFALPLDELSTPHVLSAGACSHHIEKRT